MVKGKHTGAVRNKRRDILSILASIAIIILLNYSASFIFKRFDLTSEKRYTLSPSTRQLLEGLNDEVFLKVYLGGNFNATFTRLRNETREMLDEFRAYAGDNLQYEFITPGEGLPREEAVNVERSLFQKGLLPESVTMRENGKTVQATIWPGAIVSYKGKETVWQIFTRQTPGIDVETSVNNSVEDLEYTFTTAIRKLQKAKKAEVTFLQGHGELDTLSQYDLMHTLGEYYGVNYTTIAKGRELTALKGTDALVISKPDSAFTDREIFVIDQFIMNGGKVLWLIDPVLTNADSLRKGFTIGLTRPLNIEEMLFKYGVRLNPVLVQDLQCGALNINVGFQKGQPRFQLFPWLYMPLAASDNGHPITKNLDLVKFDFASTLDTIASAKGIKKTILLRTSRYTKTQPTPARIYLGSVQMKPKESQFKNGYQPLACLLEGEFRSFIEYRLPDTLLKSKEFTYLDKGKPTKMIVVADGDVARNDVQGNTGQVFPLGFDRNTKQTFANKTFLLNCLNYLLDDEGMLQLRAREVKLRLLDRKKTDASRLKWQVINVVIPVVVVSVLALVLAWLRRRRYAPGI
jgi:ABC-2 type transport system permease protein